MLAKRLPRLLDAILIKGSRPSGGGTDKIRAADVGQYMAVGKGDYRRDR